MSTLLSWFDLSFADSSSLLPPGNVQQSQGFDDVKKKDNVETLRLMFSRWEKLFNDLWDEKTEKFDISKIPDIYDCCKYDAIHNQDSLGFETLEAMYRNARSLAELVCPAEYGLTRAQRLEIGCTICRNLIDQIGRDMEGSVASYRKGAKKEETEIEKSDEDEDTHAFKINTDFLSADQLDDEFVEGSIKTRLYFTSESHLHSVINALRFINVRSVKGAASGRRHKKLFDESEQRVIDGVKEYDYLTQIVFKVCLNLSEISF